MEGIFVRQLIPFKKAKNDLFFLPIKRREVTKSDPRWQSTKTDNHLSEDFRYDLKI
jgi:hypothetical protein